MADQVVFAENPSTTSDAPRLSFQEFLDQYGEQHAEWVHGEVEVVVSNNSQHQIIQAFLFGIIQFILAYRDLGIVLSAGMPMYLGDDKPAREPDIGVLFNEHLDRIKETYIDGPFDIAVEIVSPGSTARDRGDKLAEYEAAQVQEYWLIDPLRHEARVYALQDDGRYMPLPFNEPGQLVSGLLTDFALDPTLLWAEDVPRGPAYLDLLRGMGVL
jgi:Uma2 family endonuclease